MSHFQKIIDHLSKENNYDKKLLIEFLSNYDIFNSFDKKQQFNLDRLSSKVSLHLQHKNTFLYHANSYSEYIYILLSGEVVSLKLKHEVEINEEIKFFLELNRNENELRLIKKENLKNKLLEENDLLQKRLRNRKNINENLNEAIFKNCGQFFRNQYFLRVEDKIINKYKQIESYQQGKLLEYQNILGQISIKKNQSIFTLSECHFCCLKISDWRQIMEEKLQLIIFLNNNLIRFIVGSEQILHSYLFNTYLVRKDTLKEEIVFQHHSVEDGKMYFIYQGKFEYRFNIKNSLMIIEANPQGIQFLKQVRHYVIKVIYFFQGILGIEQKNCFSIISNKEIMQQFGNYSVICTEKGVLFQFTDHMKRLILQDISARNLFYKKHKEMVKTILEKVNLIQNQIKITQEVQDFISRKRQFILNSEKLKQYLMKKSPIRISGGDFKKPNLEKFNQRQVNDMSRKQQIKSNQITSLRLNQFKEPASQKNIMNEYKNRDNDYLSSRQVQRQNQSPQKNIIRLKRKTHSCHFIQLDSNSHVSNQSQRSLSPQRQKDGNKEIKSFFLINC